MKSSSVSFGNSGKAESRSLWASHHPNSVLRLRRVAVRKVESIYKKELIARGWSPSSAVACSLEHCGGLQLSAGHVLPCQYKEVNSALGEQGLHQAGGSGFGV